MLLLSRFSRVRLCATPWTAAYQASPSMDSPGKNTGVGCHFLLQCMKVESESEVAQSCLTLSDPMDCSLPGSSIHGIFRAIVLEWGAILTNPPLIALYLNEFLQWDIRAWVSLVLAGLESRERAEGQEEKAVGKTCQGIPFIARWKIC